MTPSTHQLLYDSLCKDVDPWIQHGDRAFFSNQREREFNLDTKRECQIVWSLQNGSIYLFDYPFIRLCNYKHIKLPLLTGRKVEKDFSTL